MFNKLFKPKIEHPDAEVRKAAVRDLAGDAQIPQLTHVALTDVDDGVRQLALTRLEAEFSDQCKLDANTAVKLFLLASDQAFRHKLIRCVTTESAAADLVDRLNGSESLALVAECSPLSDTRRLAAEKITELKSLRELQARSKDKSVQRIVRQKVQQIKAKEKEQQSAFDNLTRVCEALERLAKLDDDELTENRVQVLENHWADISDAYKGDFKCRYQQALTHCKQIVQAGREAALQQAYHQAQNQLCVAICDSLQEHINSLNTDSTHRWSRNLAQIQQQWVQTCAKFTPQTQVNERFCSLMTAAETVTAIVDEFNAAQQFIEKDDASPSFEKLVAIEKKLYSLTTSLRWSFSIPEPELYTQVRQQHRQFKAELASRRKEQAQQCREIDKMVMILKRHIRQKNLIKANRLFNYIHNLVNELPHSLQQREQARIDHVSLSLNELRGLGKFVTAPKKEGLCEQMEALVDAQIEPEELMLKIKAIQDKWKSLATSDAKTDDILWDRFKIAADKAYAPCEAYLNKLAQTKQANQHARKELIASVEQAYAAIDWEHVNWKQIQLQYNQYWKKWQALVPVFFSQNKPLQKQFESLMNQIKDRLNSEKQENHAICDQLIERVQQLADGLDVDNIEARIEQVKRCQASWKNIGLTHYKKSQRQWKTFSSHCDNVFEFKRKLHKTQLAEQDHQANSAYDLIDQIKSLIDTPDSALPATQAAYLQLQQAFAKISDLPQNRQEKIAKRFAQVCDQYESHLAALPKRMRLANHLTLREAAKLCVDAENLALSGADSAQFTEVIDAFNLLDSEGNHDNALRQRMQKAQAVVSGETAYAKAQLDENLGRLEELAIQLEVLFDLKSPSHAREQRMSYQLQQLQAGLKPVPDRQEKLNQLLEHELHWYAVGAIDPPQRRVLDARLAAVIKQSEG